ncbi:hypothetical protein D0962_33015 [Leptolyngbyaceae cyanobacterium CCMR0082]|uniref:Uncharacterized protein n=2 Tax=Adonisia turfae TaxID=2950184 RepID=A0A6M0SG79_9CYAN|nr:hypothetical protein [Adonisia turfae CCMR0081]NEZ67527.1 hypothetical protein [Adonisia turfae CCMR0082]
MGIKFKISQRLGKNWFPLPRGTVREGSGKLAPTVETPPPSAPPLRKAELFRIHQRKSVRMMTLFRVNREVDRREPKPVTWGPSEFPKPPWLGPGGRPRTQPIGLSSIALNRGYGRVD